MKKPAKIILFSSFILFSGVALVGCATPTIDASSIFGVTLSSSFVEVKVNESVEIDVSGENISSLTYASENSLVSVSLSDGKISITGINEGVDRVRIFYEGFNDNYKTILVNVVNSSSNSHYELEINDTSKLIYDVGDYFYYSQIYVTLNEYDVDNNLIAGFELNPDQLYYSLENGEVLTEAGEFTVNVGTYENEEFIDTSFTITVNEGELGAISDVFNAIKLSNDYEITFDAEMNGVNAISGDTIFNPNYVINEFSEYYFAKDDTGVFKYEYSTDNSGIRTGVVTRNGYFTLNNEVSTDLGEVFETYCGITGLVDFDTSVLNSAEVIGDAYFITDSATLDLFMSGTFNLNGTGNALYLSYKDGAISYTLEARLSSGVALNFVGSIFNVNSTYEPLIEDFLDRNSVVSTTVDSTLSSYLSLLKPLNYTIDLTSKGDNYVVTDRYVFFGESGDTSGNGIIETNDGLFEFRLQNNVVTLGDEVSDYTSIEESEYNLLNYDAIEESNLSKFYYTTYYGGYTMFDTSCFNEFYNFIKVNGNYTPFALTLNYEEEDVTMNVYAYNSSGNMTLIGSSLKEIGSSSISVLDNYLNNL